MDIETILNYADIAQFSYESKYTPYSVFPTFWKCKNNHESVVINFHDELIVAIRGTLADSLTDWITNLRFVGFKTECGTVKIHSGFNEGAEQLYDLLEPYIYEIGIKEKKLVTFVGHSVGGAKARALCYLFQLNNFQDANFRVVTFGCPKTGNEAFNISLNSGADVYHFTHKNDIVPYLPLFHGTHAGFNELRICRKKLLVNPNVFSRLWGRIKAVFQFKGVGVFNHLIDQYTKDLTNLKQLA